MNESSIERPAPGRRVSPRRVALMGSVAALAVAVLLGGPSGFKQITLPAWSNQVQAAETTLQHPADFADLIAKVKPAVISVRVKMEQTAQNTDDGDGPSPLQPGSPMEKFFRQFGDQQFGQQFGQQQRRAVTGEGSGFFISTDGYAVTNNHVVDHAKTVTVTTDDGAIHTANVVGTDPRSDLALIKVEGGSFAYVKFSDHAPRIGEWAVAVGNPFGLGGTVTAGIVSATGRDIGSANDYIQIDAPINRGNSGGPTFDTDGNVMGINTAIFSPSGGSVGIGFDIPAATAKNVIAQLKDNGHVTRGWLGVQIQPVTADVADALGLKQTAGALVAEPQSGSPAAQAGVKAGDVIVSLDGTSVKDARELSQKIGTMSPGSSIKLGLIREGGQQTINVTLGQMADQQKQAQAGSPQEDRAQSSARLGLTLAPASATGAGDRGVVVTGVDPNGPAAEHGIKTGDVITNVGGTSVSTPAEVQKQLAELRKAGKRSVLMQVKSDQGTHYVALPLATS
ncbi:MAG TPA: Do family serine endopeptidase [Xanthobacteraceae bacterium]